MMQWDWAREGDRSMRLSYLIGLNSAMARAAMKPWARSSGAVFALHLDLTDGREGRHRIRQVRIAEPHRRRIDLGEHGAARVGFDGSRRSPLWCSAAPRSWAGAVHIWGLSRA